MKFLTFLLAVNLASAVKMAQKTAIKSMDEVCQCFANGSEGAFCETGAMIHDIESCV